MNDTAVAAPASGANLFNGYVPPPGIYDEMFTPTGEIRGHAQKFAELISGVGAPELTRRWEQADRLVRESGLMYSAYGDDQLTARPWRLDPLPLILDHNEWQTVSAALIQRARLFNAVLGDLYGPQTLLESGLLPASLLYSHPGFIRPFHAVRPADDCHLNFYAADLARSPDGEWWVLADRTDAPLGPGYALENRIVVSRMLPELVRELHVERQASFFIELRETLHRLAPQHRENPRIVLLSQGPSGPNYFEDAYLARYLGYALVEGGDLTVRDERVFLKTLGGLLQVDVIYRRMSDIDCDPLEVPADAALGVPGLLAAIRAGNVAVANPLGSSLVESMALAPFMSPMCRELLNEDLLMPNIATWWCGQPEARQYVFDNVSQLAIHSAFRVGRMEIEAPADLAAATAEQRHAAIEADPRMYVGREQVARASCPVWSKSVPQAAYVALRTFVVTTADGYQVFPGGLVRVAAAPADLDLSFLAGESSKDAWVLFDKPVRDVSLLRPAGQQVQLRRGGVDLPSRVADNVFWLGRRVERAEGACRLLRAIIARLTSEAEPDAIPELPRLIRVLAAFGHIEPSFAVEEMKQPLPSIVQALPEAVFDAQQIASLRCTMSDLHFNASLVRDRLSQDSWRILHRVEQHIEALADRHDIGLADLLDLTAQMTIDLAAFDGMVSESMTRTHAWRFLDLGRRLERAVYIVTLVQHCLADATEQDAAAMEAVLEITDSIMTYRSRYLASLHMPGVLDLLLTDETNPRSLAFQIVALADHVERLPRDDAQPLLGPEQRIAMTLLHNIRLVEIETLSTARESGQRSRLDRMLDRMADQLPRLSELIAHRYLIHAAVPRQLAESR